MKFIPENVWKYLSVKLPIIGAFLLGVLPVLIQEGINTQLIPTEYHAILLSVVLPALAYIGRKIAQPKTQALGFATITAGHSNTDPGAVNGQFKEAELVTKFRNAVSCCLQQAGIQHKMDGIGSTNLNLNAALKLIKGSSVAVEFHMNAAASPQANGIETISLPKDKKLAQDLSKAVATVLSSRLRGDNGWIDQSKSARGRLAFVSNGGLIVELGFISNEDELARFNARYWLAAKAVAKVLIDYEKGLK